MRKIIFHDKIPRMQNYSTALTIAGSDCSGGAGIQADLKTFAALNCYGMSVITALTAQNTQGVQAIHTIPPAFVAEQLQSIFADIEVNAVKTGMLFSADIITAMVTALQRYPVPALVVDPVMTAKNGSLLLQVDAIETLQTKLFPLAALITPNIPEAEWLLKTKISDDKMAMEQAAKALAAQGAQAVLLKGGHHLKSASADCLYVQAENKWHWFDAPRISTNNTHGTGCTLSAAITAFLARGYSLLAAVDAAKKYTTSAIIAGSHYSLGQGQGPLQHFYPLEN